LCNIWPGGTFPKEKVFPVPVEVRTSIPEPESLAERRRAWLERSHLYLVCEAHPAGMDPEDVLRPALQAGVDVVQLREKSARDRDIVEAGRVFRRLCDAYDALFIVNDQAELAVACAADGVHIGQDDASPGEVRRVIGHDALIGLSTHSREEVDAAAGVDYISVGPVYPTPTKPEYASVGLDLVHYAAEHAGTPFFAIGGVDADNVDDVLDAGASRVAVVRAIQDAVDPGEAARELRMRITAKLGVGTPD
jgi:thiamine-phosphate pyrophosphorylase